MTIKRMHVVSALLALVSNLLTLLLSTSVGQAQTWDSYFGKPIKWRQNVRVERNQCSIGYPGDRYNSYYYGVHAWDDPSQLTVIYDVRPIGDCTYENGDGINEVSVVGPNNYPPAVAGATTTRIACSSYANSGTYPYCDERSLYEMDVAVVGLTLDSNGNPQNIPFSDPSATSLGWEGRAVFVHEFGHAFGFSPDNDLHETATMSTMRASVNQIPKTGGTPSATVWPTDTHGLHTVYGMTSLRPNMIVSAHGLDSNDNVVLLDSGTRTVCRGGSTSITIYIGNSGNTSSGAFYIETRVGEVGRTSGEFGGFGSQNSISGFGEVYRPHTVFISQNVPLGTNYINIDIDPADTVLEVTNADNWTISGVTLNVVDCP